MTIVKRTYNDGSYDHVDTETGILQGETRSYYHGKPWRHGFYKNGELHGEFRKYNLTGTLREARYYCNGKVIQWSGTKSLSKQEKTLYVLKYGGEFIKD